MYMIKQLQVYSVRVIVTVWLVTSVVLTGNYLVRENPLQYISTSPTVRQNNSGDIANRTARALYTAYPETSGKPVSVWSETPFVALPYNYWLYPSQVVYTTADIHASTATKQQQLRDYIANPQTEIQVYVGSLELLESSAARPAPNRIINKFYDDGSTIAVRYSK